VRLEIDRLAALDSPLHRWDPRFKLVTLLVFMAMAAVERAGARSAPTWAQDLPPALATLACALVLAAAARIPAGAIAAKLRGAAALLAVVLIVFPLAHGGERVHLGPLSLSRSGIIAAVLLVVRAFALLIVALVALGTTRFHVMVKALRSLRVPAPMVAMALFSYRYLLVHADQLRRRQIALKVRGFRPRADLRTLRTIGNGFGGLIVLSIERTQRIQTAMKCRGFTGTLRTLEEFRARPSDFVIAGMVLLAGAGLLLWTVL
jgi:cobalt/nickel transport system permease protein